MAKLNISADPTLVAAATRMHMANVPKDQAKMLENFTSQYGELMDSVSTNFNRYVKHRDDMDVGAIDAAGNLQESIQNEGLDFDKTAQEEFQKEYEEIKNGIASIGLFDKDRKTKLAEFEQRANSLIRKRKSNGETGAALIEAYTNNQVSNTTDPSVHGLAGAIFNDAMGKNVDGFSKSWVKGEGEYMYHYDYTNEKGETTKVSMTLSEVSKALDIKNNEILVKAGDILINQQKHGAKLGPDGNYADLSGRTMTDMEALFKTNRGQGFKDIINNIVPGTTISYHDALYKPNSPESQLIFSELYNLDKTYDTSPPYGKIDEKDFKTPENYEALVKSLTDPKTPDEIAVAHRLAANFYANHEGRKAFEYGQAISGKKPDTGDDDEGGGKGWSVGSGKYLPVHSGDRHAPPGAAEAMLESMEAAVKGEKTSFNLFDEGYYYDPKTDTWTEGQGEDAVTYGPKDGSSGTERLIKSLGIFADPFKNLKSSVQGDDKTSVSGFDWENLSTDEEDAVLALNKFYADKGLSFKSKPNPFGEYVTFKNTRYDLEDPASVENLKNAVENSVSGGELD